MVDTPPTLFTIGHSTHALAEFLALLRRHEITAVADVRSQPYGRLEQFNRENLAASLKASGIEYVFLGQQLGARRGERECYEEGVARYERIVPLAAFQEGLDRLRRGAVKYRLAVMCAEKEPLSCHRAILIARCLHESGVRVQHILADGTLEDHAQAERRLVRELDIRPTLFEPHQTERDRIDQAYAERGREIAYREHSEEPLP